MSSAPSSSLTTRAPRLFHRLRASERRRSVARFQRRRKISDVGEDIRFFAETSTTIKGDSALGKLLGPLVGSARERRGRSFVIANASSSSSTSSSSEGGGGGGGGDDEEEEEEEEKTKKEDVRSPIPPPLPPLPPIRGQGKKNATKTKVKTKEEEEEEEKKYQKLQNSLFLSLLVTEGAIKGSAMTLLGLALNVKVIDSFRFLNSGISGSGAVGGDAFFLDGVSSAVGIGIACAMPLVLVDFAIMNLFFPGESSSSSSSTDSSSPSLKTAVSNYAKEASLNNPCLDMAFYKDAIVAFVARVADSFACVFTLGFLFTWITERGVEYGYEVYEIENTTKWLALAATVLGKEAMLFYQNYRKKGFGTGGDKTPKPAMRAYVVTRDKITGKEKMEEITTDKIEAKKKRGEKLEPQELAIESAMYNMNVRSTIDDWRERISNGLLGFSFVISGGNGAAPLVGGLLGDLLFCVYQRNNVNKYLEEYGEGNGEKNSSSGSTSSISSSSDKKMRTSIAVAKARQREMQSVLTKKMKEKEGETSATASDGNDTSGDSSSSSSSSSSSTSSTAITSSSQKINEMVQTVQKEASLVARLVVEADAKESLLSSSPTPALTTSKKTAAEKKALKALEQKLPSLMTGLFDGDTPELSEYEVAFDKALELLRAEKASLDSKIQSLDDDIEKYRAMFSFIFPEDQSEDGK